jgi:hypothetical protein
VSRDQRRSPDSDLPPALGFALWVQAWLRGATSLDEARDAIVGPDVLHLVAGLPGQTDGAEPLILGLGRLRSAGAVGTGIALPAPGDPVGLAGPAPFNQAATERGAAVLLTGTSWGLVPEPLGSSLTWAAAPARTDAPPLDPREADRALRAAVSTTATAMADLEVARWSPDATDALMALRRRPERSWPPQVGPRASASLELALGCLRVCDLALADAGGARTVSEVDLRREVLTALSAVARRAVVATVGSPSW